MNIAVCIKQVPHPDYLSKIVLDPVTKRLRREGIPLVINPVDRNAIELGLQLKERFPGKVSVLTMGPPESREALEEALAMGADEGILLSDRGFAGADTFATAYALSSAISRFCPADLILCGNETVDSGTSQVGPQLAEFLDIPHVTNINSLELITEKIVIVKRSLDNGYMKVRLQLPGLVTVTREINEPRLPTVIGIMGVAAKPLKTYGMVELGLSPEQVGICGSPTQTANIFESKQERSGQVLRGEAEQVVREAVRLMRELHVL